MLPDGLLVLLVLFGPALALRGAAISPEHQRTRLVWSVVRQSGEQGTKVAVERVLDCFAGSSMVNPSSAHHHAPYHKGPPATRS